MTSVKDSVIAHSDLTDCLLLDAAKQFVIKNCTPNRITKPVVGICWNFKQSGIFTPMIDTALRKHGAIPLRFEYMPDDVNPELLSREVEHLIGEVEAAKPQEMLSIPHEILKRAGARSEIARIKVRAENYLKQCDGLALPGGLDIEPEYYQERRGAETFSDPDPRRSVTEFALLSVAHQNKIPTMGTCRGSQLINIYFGGTLKQHVPGQSGLQRMEFTDSSRKDWMRALVGDGFHGYSAHHQASDRMGKELEVVMQAEGVKKFFISRDGNFIGSQIHPEIHPSLEEETEMIKNLLLKTGIEPDAELKNRLAFYEKTIQGNKNIYKFFMEKTARRTSL
ncbi:MAG: gamma-glutamyl-gamma-aminobutyrate hydrolase family protein [Chlamydiales bacterium]